MEERQIAQEWGINVLEQRGMLVSKIILLAISIFWFFPLIKISDALDIISMKLNGISATFGLTQMGEKLYPGALFFGLLFLIPATVFVLNFLCKRLYDVVICNLVGAVAELFILMLYLIGLPKKLEEYFIMATFGIAFYIEILLAVALAALSVYLLCNIKNITIEKKVESPEIMCIKGYVFVVLYCLSIIVIVWGIVNINLIKNILESTSIIFPASL